MAAQAKVEGRYLGGRPPYGYRLADAGPHPNPSKAADGKRLHRLEPDPVTAPVVGRIFAEFVRGKGLLAIAESLTRDGILCPSAYDRARNSHRSGIAWSKAAVRAILLNPRYTGMQVWNRQHKDEILIDVNDVALGHTTKLRWNDQESWIWSENATHEALVSDEAHAQVQALLVVSRSAAEGRKLRRTPCPYIFRGRLFCGICYRRMQGSWNNNKAPHYRCKFSREYAQANSVKHPLSVYVREELIVEPLDRWLATAFDPEQFPTTIQAMTDSQLASDHRLAAVKLPAKPSPSESASWWAIAQFLMPGSTRWWSPAGSPRQKPSERSSRCSWTRRSPRFLEDSPRRRSLPWLRSSATFENCSTAPIHRTKLMCTSSSACI
ncbi:recombinase family protein [Nonomuraea sp. NEAU-A123]|uniref:recombinase family protein n=1 Tax=Nonomuraea sp. NEAU-A123 TaxID=2839649 RepID=UPI001BE4660B|nr:recombinase family protein [Nonomuraea sp. NEAU-A123]MBT2233496.1 recombinase family protein [Nonomuraea sp. NEAU-A123]